MRARAASSRSASRPRSSSRSPRPDSAPALPILDPVITLNSGGVIQSASDSIQQLFGWKPSELFGRNVKELIPEPRRSALDRYLDRYRHPGRAKTLSRSHYFDAVRKDGSLIRIELSMARADLPSQAPPYFIGVIRDVTHQIDISPDTDASRLRLQRLISEQTRAIATISLRLHLADRMASLGTLAAGLGHDLNNVLLPVRARLDALQHAGITSAALGHLKAVRRSITYLQHLSDGLHYLAIDPDRDDNQRDALAHTDLNIWWNQVGALFRKAVPRHVTLQASLPKGLPAVSIAPHLLTQAVLNLIVNAGESIPESRRAGRVLLWAKAADSRRIVKVGVTDNGRGMTARVQRHALDLFFTTKSRTMGTGLGLPLARKIVDRAAGQIELKSTPGKGTSVVLSFPARPRAKAPRRPGLTQIRSAAISVRNPRIASLVSQVLSKEGVSIKVATGIAPKGVHLWITDPTPRRLRAAVPWRKRHPESALILVATPAKRTLRKWMDLGAIIIDSPDSVESVFFAVRQALLNERPKP